MSITLGLDIGTTSITALALDAEHGAVLATATTRNTADITTATDRARGRSEWYAETMVRLASGVLREVAIALGDRLTQVCGLGLTGQQHGVVLVDPRGHPLTPFINWQDQRGNELYPGTTLTYTEAARARVGPDAPLRTGCTLASGYLGTTLFWLRETDALPTDGLACFITDFIGSRLTDAPPVTDPTMAASSGLLNLSARDWDTDACQALGLPATLFPPIREAGVLYGQLTPTAAATTGLPVGLPVYVGLGDNQASFLGSVADQNTTVLVNVGTGAQVGRYVTQLYQAPPLEMRPFPRQGYLLVHAGLSGGRTYAVLERFFRQVGLDLFEVTETTSLFARMNDLARGIPPGADGLRCEPFFRGSRSEPERRAVWRGMSDVNLTPGHLVRALLEGMAHSFAQSYAHIQTVTDLATTTLVGAGNGLRENDVLAALVATEFGLPLKVPTHREEAAYGAALVAAVGAGVWPDLATAGQLVRYQPSPHNLNRKIRIDF